MTSRTAPAREAVTAIALVGAGVATFASNQSVGVTLPVHVITQMGGTSADVGMLAAAGTVGVIGGRLVSGAIVERIGPSVLGAVSMTLVAAACLGYLVTPYHLVGLAFVRAVHGVAFAWATTALFVAMLTAVRSMSEQRSMARANLAMPVSLAVFPVVAIEVLGASLANVAAAAAVIGLAGGAMYLLVAKTPAPGPAAALPPSSLSPVVPRVPMRMLAVAAVLGAADAAAFDYLPVLGITRDIEGYGWGFTVFAIGTASTLGLITATSRVVLPSAYLVVGGGLATAAALAMWPWVSSFGPLMLVVGAYGVGFAIAQTGVAALAVEWSPAQQGKALAAILLAFDVGRAAGVYAIGVLIASSGFVAAFVPVASLLALVSITSVRRRHRHRHR